MCKIFICVALLLIFVHVDCVRVANLQYKHHRKTYENEELENPLKKVEGILTSLEGIQNVRLNTGLPSLEMKEKKEIPMALNLLEKVEKVEHHKGDESSSSSSSSSSSGSESGSGSASGSESASSSGSGSDSGSSSGKSSSEEEEETHDVSGLNLNVDLNSIATEHGIGLPDDLVENIKNVDFEQQKEYANILQYLAHSQQVEQSGKEIVQGLVDQLTNLKEQWRNDNVSSTEWIAEQMQNSLKTIREQEENVAQVEQEIKSVSQILKETELEKHRVNKEIYDLITDHHLGSSNPLPPGVEIPIAKGNTNLDININYKNQLATLEQRRDYCQGVITKASASLQSRKTYLLGLKKWIQSAKSQLVTWETTQKKLLRQKEKVLLANIKRIHAQIELVRKTIFDANKYKNHYTVKLHSMQIQQQANVLQEYIEKINSQEKKLKKVLEGAAKYSLKVDKAVNPEIGMKSPPSAWAVLISKLSGAVPTTAVTTATTSTLSNVAGQPVISTVTQPIALQSIIQADPISPYITPTNSYIQTDPLTQPLKGLPAQNPFPEITKLNLHSMETYVPPLQGGAGSSTPSSGSSTPS